MATKQARGTKRTCQNEECGARFYDLERNPINCPICGSIYALAHAPEDQVIEDEAEKAAEKAKLAKGVDDDADDEQEADETEAVEELADLEDEDDIADGDDNDAFLEEEEEDSGSVSDIIPAKPSGKDES